MFKMEEHFATLKLVDSDADWKLTEAHSYSKTPRSYQISVKEMFEFKTDSNLVRQNSFEQTFYAHTKEKERLLFMQIDDNKSDKDQTTDTFYFDLFKCSGQFSKSNNILQAPKFTPTKASKCLSFDPNVNTNVSNEFDHFPSTIFENNEKADNRTEEVDIKKNSKNCDKSTYQDIKNKYRPLVVKKKKKKTLPEKKINMCYYSCLTLCILPIIMVIFSLFLNFNLYAICDRTTLFSNASQELQQKLYGQENAISSIVEHLSNDLSYLKILCLIGGTGVGKSYTAEIIATHFPLKSKIFVYDALLDYSMDTNAFNSFDSYQLIIIENLKLMNLDTFSNMIDVLSKMKDKCITVMAIFNVEEVNDNLERKVDLLQGMNRVNEALAKTKMDTLIIPYQLLSEEVLEICIAQAAIASNLKLTLEQINEIKQSLLLSGSGCKGAYAKVQIVARYNNR
ncbi:uncharacterized protein LOC143431495 [Xylocopa sonorina]|uniref:uncharacterized protein LOC143431495 n=1 Tax=Xylocopa sonorina TaxID=1818115 RepID=UPI00403B3490